MNALINKIRNNLSLIILYRVLVIVFLVMILFFNLLQSNFTGIKSIMEIRNSETFFDTLLPFVIINYLYFLTFSFFDKKFFTKHKQSHFILIILIFFIIFYFKINSIYTGSTGNGLERYIYSMYKSSYEMYKPTIFFYISLVLSIAIYYIYKVIFKENGATQTKFNLIIKIILFALNYVIYIIVMLLIY